MLTKFDNMPMVRNNVWYLARKIAAADNPMSGSTSVRWCAQHAIMDVVDSPLLVATAGFIPEIFLIVCRK